jgi:hypothetical protein
MADRLYTPYAPRDTMIFDAANNAIEAVEVTYSGPNGITGKVVVAKAVFSPEHVDRMIREDLAPKLAVLHLGQE